MSRTLDALKFRAYHKPTSTMYDIRGLCRLPESNKIELYYGDYGIVSYPVDDVILLQWTGLTDSKGVDVYEGDIMIHNGEKRVIAWHKDRAEFYMKILNHDGYYGDLNKWTIVNDNIIGSIHTEDK